MLKLNGEGPVVVVDDNEDALAIAEVVFKMAAVPNELMLIESGEDLLSYLNRVGEGELKMPSIVLLDISMPTLSGFETLNAIRAQEPFRNLPSIVMFTASNDEKDMERALGQGANAYHVKPLDLNDFVNFASSLVP